MSENGPARGGPGPEGSDGSASRDAHGTQNGHDALEWRERDHERARLLLERAGDIARRIERVCGNAADRPLPAGRPKSR